VVKDVASVVCNPANFTPTPTAEGSSYVQQAFENDILIRQTGSIPAARGHRSRLRHAGQRQPAGVLVLAGELQLRRRAVHPQ